MSRLVELMADALAKEPMPTPRGGFFRVGRDIGKITVNTNQQVENRVVKLSSWDEWKPPQSGMLRAIGRARLGVLPWCLLAICHAWDERMASVERMKRIDAGMKELFTLRPEKMVVPPLGP